MGVMGLGPWVSLLCAVCFLATVASFICAFRSLRAGANEQLPVMRGGGTPDFEQHVVEATVVPLGSGSFGKAAGGGKGGADAAAGAPAGGAGVAAAAPKA